MSGAALATVEQAGALARPFDDGGISIEKLLERVDKIKEVQARVMKQGQHYGKVPGVDKPTLLKPGAEILGLTFQLAPEFAIEDRWDGPHLECVVTCKLIHAPSETFVGSGIGSCSTRESKYAWRKAERECPACGEPAIIKGKAEYGGGWLCWNKPEKGKHGCGAKFPDGDESIELQQTDRVPNPDIADQYNTIRKMACKRAHVAAILFVTCASEIFTQDVEDLKQKEDDAKRSAHGDRPDEGRGRQPQQRRQQQDGPKPIPRNGDKHSAEVTAKLLAELASVDTLDDLAALDDELLMLKAKRELTRDDATSLTQAFAERHARLNHEAPAPVGANH